MAKKRISHVLLCLFILLILAGCWDSTPIEERGFVVGSALDMKEGRTDGNQELTLTNQFVVPPAISAAAGEEGGGSEAETAFTNVSASGDSIDAMDTEMASLTSKMPFFEHLKLLVISEELASESHLFANTFDIFLRSNQMRRTVKVVVAGDEARELLDFQPKNEQLPAVFINDMLEKSLEKTGLFKPALVGDIHQYLLRNNSFTIPRMSLKGNNIEYDGSAVFHGYKDRMVGTLNKEEMTALNLMLNGMNGGTLEFEYKGDLITFQVYNAKNAIKIDDKNPESIKFNAAVGLEGAIAEVFGNKNMSNPQHIEGIEKAAAKKVEEIINDVVEKSQQELHADIFDFDNQLRERHYDTWQMIKDDWDHGEDYYAKSKVNVKAEVKIRTAGASNKSEGNRKE